MHMSARGGGHGQQQQHRAAGAQPMARAARDFFLGRRLRIAFSCEIRGKPGSQLGLQGTRVRVGCKQTTPRAGLVHAYTRRAQRPQIFEEELLKGVPATVRRSSVSMEQPRERTCSERTTASEAQVKSASSAGKRQGETVCRCGAGAGAWSSGWAGRQARTRARAAAAAAGHRVRRFGMASVSPSGRGRRRRDRRRKNSAW